MAAKKPLDVRAFAIAILRRGSYKWPARTIAFQNSRVGRNQYICAHCSPFKIYRRQDVQADHKKVVVNLTGWDGFDGFIERLYCQPDGFQILCKPCHQAKTDAETVERRKNRKKKVRKAKK